ncbi:hypothetical protein EVAR_100465_1 [Eumeta japonica]|uniref:Uncharacterized protein n=1 Tax=Eumeta variegata TaxID=151549 RepID=A0A4C2A1V9_EUMVA|nr:hypothetical protein EVAR_100465_1 [Eumeta japonica]
MAKQIMMRFSLGDRRVYWATFKYFLSRYFWDSCVKKKPSKWDNLNQKWNRNRDQKQNRDGDQIERKSRTRNEIGITVDTASSFPKEGSELNVKTG